MHKLMRAAVLAAFGLGIAIPSTYADANMFWKHSKVPAGEVFANTNGVAYIAGGVAKAEIQKNAKDPSAPVPVAVGEKINQASNAVVFVSKGYTDGAIASAADAGKAYTDNATNETLKAAKDYADSKIGVSKEYVDNADATTLASAKTYTDGATNDLKTVLEEQIQTAKDDAIGAAKNYTDGQIGGLRTELTTNLQQFATDHDADVLIEATTRANTAASNALTTAKSYTDGKFNDEHNVKYEDFGGEGRKTIQLKNYDNISGIATDGTGYNLVMLSKWDVADFGAKGVHFNMNTKDKVTINDKAIVATTDDVASATGETFKVSKAYTDTEVKIASHKLDDQKRDFSSLIYREAVNEHWVWTAVSDNCPDDFFDIMNRPGAPKPHLNQPSATTFEWGGVSVYNKDGSALYENDLTPAAADATEILFWYTGPGGIRFQVKAKRNSATDTTLVAWEFIATHDDINGAINLAQTYIDGSIRNAKNELKGYTDNSIRNLNSTISTNGIVSSVVNTEEGAGVMFTTTDGVSTFIGTCNKNDPDCNDVAGRILIAKGKTKTKINFYEQKVCYLKNDDPDDVASRDKYELAIKDDVTGAETRSIAHADSKDSLLKEELEGKIATAEANAKAYADNLDTLKLPLKFKKGANIYTLDVIDNGGDDISLSLVRTPAE